MSDFFAHKILPAGTWPPETAVDRITLDYEGRHRRRFRYVSDTGIDFVLDLERTTLLHDGDGLQLDDGRIVAVSAAAEALVEVSAADSKALLRLAWHIGNRHLPAQLSAERILIRDDAVIVAMLRGLGARVEPITAAFTPERGAYAHSHDSAHPYVLAADSASFDPPSSAAISRDERSPNTPTAAALAAQKTT